MSAESPRRSRSQTRSGAGPATVAPQLVTDPTILDSVAGFINDVVPTAYNPAIPAEVEDKIQWAHFEQLDFDESTFSPNFEGDNAPPPPLILVLGYTTGIQIWAVPATGEATEILSWRHSTLRVLKLIPTPFKTGSGDTIDLFASARPLIALCDSTANYSTLTFRSLKADVIDPVKQIQFKSSILNVVANRRSVVVTFAEKIAVFDAFTLENRISITTCYLSPGIQPNPIALGDRWLAYAEKKLNSANRSGGGNEGEGVQSYTATVLHAAKSLGRGLRELTETVAGSLTGNPNFKPGSVSSSPQAGGAADVAQKGIVTILDVESKNVNTKENTIPQDSVICHFVAHTEAIVCMSFDPSGTLLLTSDRRGHDFHVFRIHAHPGGPALAAVHHLYVLHRGDTSAKIQDMCFSPDSRWVTVSSLRGTTHVFPITPYGGNISVRTHATAHVVNKMSRYQRSAGLTSEGRSSSPVTLTESPVSSLFPYRNPRFPPYPQPTVVNPLAQIRQPVYVQNAVPLPQRQHTGRPRLTSSSEENIFLRVVANFASPRAWMDVKTPRETSHKPQVKPVESLFVMSCYGTLVQYDLEPHPTAGVPRERVCNDTAIELKVGAKAQWLLHRQPHAVDIPLPMSEENLSFIAQSVPLYKKTKPDHNDDHWLSQVEIVTHLGPHRRLWMGPQFTFKTYTITNGTVVETKSVDVRRSKPVNMPVSKANAILIESGSASSCEQLFLDTYHKACEEVGSAGEMRLKEDLADAMLESPVIRDAGGHCVIVSMKPLDATATVAKVVNPLGTVVTVQSDDDSAETDVVEEVIHENCDEALFRPVVAPKAVFYSENKPRGCVAENMVTKSLAANTEVTVRILKRGDNKDCGKKQTRIREGSPKVVRVKEKEVVRSRENKSGVMKSNHVETKMKNRGVEKVSVVSVKEDKVQDPLLAKTANIREKFDVIDSFSIDLPPLDPLDFSIEPDSPLFEDAEECEKTQHTTATNKNDQSSEITCSSEEEKPAAPRKTRKPKPKLGVRISKEREEITISSSDIGFEPEVLVVNPPAPAKRSWNIVAASKPASKEKIVDFERDFEIPAIECEENFTFRLPTKKDDDLIDDVEKVNCKNEDFNLLKIDKSSDDGSSPAETTESSDDSSKIPPVANIIDIDDDNTAPVQNSQSVSKTSRRKSKKKRK